MKKNGMKFASGRKTQTGTKRLTITWLSQN